MPFQLSISQFEGPLDMLLYLISKAKIDIQEVFVSEVTQQYIDFVHASEMLDMEDASAFLQMAATLLEIKSRKLIPREKMEGEEEEEDPQALLLKQLEAYKVLKEFALDMRTYEKAAAQLYNKLPEEYPLPPPTFELTNLTLEGLLEAFSKLLQKTKEEDEEKEEQQERQILRDLFPVPLCMNNIMQKVKNCAMPFLLLMQEAPSKDEVVSTFLALLELVRLGKVSVVQGDIFGQMMVSKKKQEQAVKEA